MNTITYAPLTQDKFDDAVSVVLRADLDTKEEIEHHLSHTDAHIVALDGNTVVGVIGWYQDTVHYADGAMGKEFPGETAYWVGFFAVDKQYRHLGIGKTLLQKLEALVREKGADTLWVSSVPETKEYYYSHGFSLVMEGTINGNQKFFCKKEL